MSDYLGRLAERAIGVAQSIKPRAPYRFEAVAKRLSDISHEPADEAARTDDAERAPDTPARNPPTGRANTLRPPSRSSGRFPADVSALPHTTVVATTSGVPVRPVTGRMKSAPMTPPPPPAIENMKQHAPERPSRRNDASISSATTRDEGTTPLQIARTEANRVHRYRKSPPRYARPARPVHQADQNVLRCQRWWSGARPLHGPRSRGQSRTRKKSRENQRRTGVTNDVHWTSSLPIARLAGTRSPQLP